MIQFEVDVICDGCGKKDRTKVYPSNVVDHYGQQVGILGWKIAEGNEFDEWGFLWKLETGGYYKQRLYCPGCFLKEKALIPKKKGILERILG